MRSCVHDSQVFSGLLLLHLPAGGVEAILDTVVQQLLDNPDRTFVYADLAFYIKWWQELHEDTKAVVRSLVQQGRFEFTNGGIVQHDEATSHYSGMVDQMSLGMRFLQAEFGVTPKIAWQVRATASSRKIIDWTCAIISQQ
jgi:alpha-mannosidase